MKDWFQVEVVYSSEGMERGDLSRRRQSLEVEADEFTRRVDAFNSSMNVGEKLLEMRNPPDVATWDYEREAAYAIPEAVKVVEHMRRDPFLVSSVYVMGIAGSETHARELEARLKVHFGE